MDVSSVLVMENLSSESDSTCISYSYFLYIKKSGLKIVDHWERQPECGGSAR